MKKLNKKGFTLVELLAVIIILAIVVGITIPAVLTTTNNAKKKAFNVAVSTIQTYIQNQYGLANLAEEFRGSAYNEVVATANCTDDSSNECKDDVENGNDTNVLNITGYEKNISKIVWTINSGKVEIACATATKDGDYLQGKEYLPCGDTLHLEPNFPSLSTGGNAGINPPGKLTQ